MVDFRLASTDTENRQFQSIQNGKLINGVDPKLIPLNKQSEWRGASIYLPQLIGKT